MPCTNSTCNTEADYSTIIGDRILPYVFTLNQEKSILHPTEGQHQTFCYDVRGVGNETSIYADLSHFLFGICNYITLDDLLNFAVTIDGKQQTIIPGKNVEIKTDDNPDKPTGGCTGLKFDFPLSVKGNMQVCFSLKKPYTVGSVNICLFGGNVTATGLTICGPTCGGVESCTPVIYQKETVCVPVTVIPYAEPGTARAVCCGSPDVKEGKTCPGSNHACYFTITQNLCIEVPISFGADIRTGTASVLCDGLSTTPCKCNEPPASAQTTNIAKNNSYK